VLRGVKVVEVRVEQALSRSGLPDIDYALNPYMGCSHACIYCYARLYTRHSEASREWGRVVVVKKNIVDVLSREVKLYKRGVVGVSTITDPYQPVEAIYGLTRKSIALLLESGFHVSIQTKNTLILRDLDMLAKHRDRVDVGFTITTPIKEVARVIEPHSPPPAARAQALKAISSMGIDTWIFYGPVIPELNDDRETVDWILEIARETRSRVLVDRLHIKPFMKSSDNVLSNLIAKATSKWWKSFTEFFMKKCNEMRVECIPGFAEPVKSCSASDKLDRYLACSG